MTTRQGREKSHKKGISYGIDIHRSKLADRDSRKESTQTKTEFTFLMRIIVVCECPGFEYLLNLLKTVKSKNF